MFHDLQADLELLARRVTLLEAIIWPGNAETSSPTAPQKTDVKALAHLDYRLFFTEPLNVDLVTET